jgi:hypothetical protein
MVTAPEVPAAIVLNGSEQPASHDPSQSNGNGNGSSNEAVADEPESYANSGSSPAAGLGIDGPAGGNGSHSRLESRRASFQRWAWHSSIVD